MLKKVLPPRFPKSFQHIYILLFCGIAFFLYSLSNVGLTLLTLDDLLSIPSNTISIVNMMFPPSFTRFHVICWLLLITFQMAFVGTVIGVSISIPFAVMASSNMSPHWSLYYFSRSIIVFSRTVPDLIWGLYFVIIVGLGPLAGTCAIVMDTLGFCGRFFAEAIEEVENGPQEAFKAMGASSFNTFFCVIFPAAMPSFVNTILFNIEKATRSSVVLGIVGAGGIGVEIDTALTMFEYDLAATIIILLCILVFVVEQVGSSIRKKIMK